MTTKLGVKDNNRAKNVKGKRGRAIVTEASSSQISGLPTSLAAERQGDIAVLRIARSEKRNALNDPTVLGMEEFFSNLPDGVKAVVIHGDGDHFCAGLDLSELSERNI